LGGVSAALYLKEVTCPFLAARLLQTICPIRRRCLCHQVRPSRRNRSPIHRSKNRMSPYRWALLFQDRTHLNHLFPRRRLKLLRHARQANHPREVRPPARAATKLLAQSFSSQV
jgi:hypothetical protein